MNGTASQKPPTLRIIFFIFIVLFMFFGPFYRQLIGGDSEIFRRWRMFRSRGAMMCAVSYHQRFPNGEQEKLNRYPILGEDSWRTSKRKFKRITSKKKAIRMGKRVCKKLGDDADVRVRLKCTPKYGKNNNWVVILHEEENICNE